MIFFSKIDVKRNRKLALRTTVFSFSHSFSHPNSKYGLWTFVLDEVVPRFDFFFFSLSFLNHLKFNQYKEQSCLVFRNKCRNWQTLIAKINKYKIRNSIRAIRFFSSTFSYSTLRATQCLIEQCVRRCDFHLHTWFLFCFFNLFLLFFFNMRKQVGCRYVICVAAVQLRHLRAPDKCSKTRLM